MQTNFRSFKSDTLPFARYAAAACATAVLAACAGPSGSSLSPSSALNSQIPIAGLSRTTGSTSLSRGHRANCTPSLWASSLQGSPPSVVGYSGGSPCITLDGSTSGMAFYAPLGLATDNQGYLYVADVDNARVVVFDSSGNYWSTLNMSSGHQPLSVCVSSLGVVGVANRDGGAGTGNVDFFASKGAQNSVQSPTGGGAAVAPPMQYNFCAFDKRGDFFVSGLHLSGGGTDIEYLRNYNVNTPNPPLQTCSIAACNNTHYWFGMYSHIRPGPVNTLSVVDNVVPQVVNFRINLGTPNHLNFTSYVPHPTTALTGYPVGLDSLYQIAPTTGQNNNSRLYMGDYGAGTIEQAPNVNTGGPVTQFASLTTAIGVATEPTGQY